MEEQRKDMMRDSGGTEHHAAAGIGSPLIQFCGRRADVEGYAQRSLDPF
jgi:hypothetical protein